MKQLLTNKKKLWYFTIVGLCFIFVLQFYFNATIEKSSTKVEAEDAQKVSYPVEDVSVSVTPAQLDVPLLQQMPELERGCEVTSLAMILQYHGIDVDKMELADNIAYEPFKENGLRGNMNQGFVGNMKTFSESGLGVYVGPIIELAEQYVDSNSIVNLTGQSTDTLYEAIDDGSPVWILTNAWFSQLPEDQFLTWQTAEGPMQVTYRQHCVVLTYYDDENVYVNDPLQSEQDIALDRSNFEKAWIQMGRQAFYINN